MDTTQHCTVSNRTAFAHVDARGFPHAENCKETLEERERRVQEHMRRIRRDPRWRGEPRRGGLTGKLAREIRKTSGARYARATRSEKTRMLAELSIRFGVSRSILRDMLRGRSWR